MRQIVVGILPLVAAIAIAADLRRESLARDDVCAYDAATSSDGANDRYPPYPPSRLPPGEPMTSRIGSMGVVSDSGLIGSIQLDPVDARCAHMAARSCLGVPPWCDQVVASRIRLFSRSWRPNWLHHQKLLKSPCERGQ